jgi:hypothetical protein
MSNRRTFFKAAGATFLGAAAVSKAGAVLLPEAVIQTSAATLPPPAPPDGRPFQPIVTLNGWSLPWRMNNGVKEFHLVAEPVVREIAPGMKANLWGYNGSSPGADHRGGRGRPHPHLRHQQAARGHLRALARHPAALGHGRGRLG